MNNIDRITQNDDSRDARAAYTLGLHDGRAAARKAKPVKPPVKKKKRRPPAKQTTSKRGGTKTNQANWPQILIGLGLAMILKFILSN
jgi:hypothetical protein